MSVAEDLAASFTTRCERDHVAVSLSVKGIVLTTKQRDLLRRLAKNIAALPGHITESPSAGSDIGGPDEAQRPTRRTL